MIVNSLTKFGMHGEIVKKARRPSTKMPIIFSKVPLPCLCLCRADYLPCETKTPANEMHLAMLSNWYHLLSTFPFSDNTATFATLHVGSATTVSRCAFEQGHVSVSQRRARQHHPVRVESCGRNRRGSVRRQHIRVQEITEGLYCGQGL